MNTPFTFADTSGLAHDGVKLQLIQTLPGNPLFGWVPAYRFAILPQAGGAAVGDISLRIGMTDRLYLGGNIGYTVYEPYRGNRYARRACMALFPLCRRHGMASVLITCNPDNLPSRRTIEGLPGARLVETLPVPPGSELYVRGDREKCVFLVPVP